MGCWTDRRPRKRAERNWNETREAHALKARRRLFTMRVTDEERQMFQRLAERERVTVAAAIVQAVRQALVVRAVREAAETTKKKLRE